MLLNDLPSKMIDGQPWVPLLPAQAIVAELQTKLQAQNTTLRTTAETLEIFRAFFFGFTGTPYDAVTAEITDYIIQGENFRNQIMKLTITTAPPPTSLDNKQTPHKGCQGV